MKVHHSGHHQAYTDKLNGGLAELAVSAPALAALPLATLLTKLPEVPEKQRGVIRNHGGGYVNHDLFWNVMCAPSESGAPTAGLAAAINAEWGSLDKFKEAFAAVAVGVFGSGWAWLVAEGGKLRITATSNQDTPAMDGKTPILGLDVWEHAYYLKYQNKRAAYVGAWWNVVNWAEVSRRFDAAK